MTKGIITAVRDLGTIWQIDVAERFSKGKPSGKVTTISGDWRPMRDSLDSAFDIAQGDFPYVSNAKIYENVIGQEIEYTKDDIMGASSWRPTGRKLFSLRVDNKTGKIEMLKKVI